MHIPKLCRNKSRNRAFVTDSGKRVYLGAWGSKEAEEAYRIYVGRLTAGLPGFSDEEKKPSYTLLELVAEFLETRQNYYVRNGKQTRQLSRFKIAVEYPLKLFAHTPVASFGPKKLLDCRDAMEASGRFSRKYINVQINCIRQIFKFGVERELIPPEVLVGLQSVAPLKRGRSSAKELAPIGPVAASDVEATIPFLASPVAAMVKLQRLTGMRPGEVCAMRAGDVQTTGEVWLYVLRADKTDYRRAVGDKKIVPLGPKAQAILTPYLAEKEGNPDAFLFAPEDSARERALELRRARKTPMTPSQAARNADRKLNPRRKYSDSYNVNSYRQAIVRACRAAGVPQWAPNRLRHLYATEIRAKYGLEQAQIMLGHANAAVTQIYAERDSKRAREIALIEG